MTPAMSFQIQFARGIGGSNAGGIPLDYAIHHLGCKDILQNARLVL